MSAVIYKTQEELDAALAEWQIRLRLQDWDITAKVVRRDDIDTDPSNRKAATVYREWRLNSADIKILDPIDRVGRAERDMESDLVHELLHIHTRQILDQIADPEGDICENWTRAERVEERFVYQMAVILVKLKYEAHEEATRKEEEVDHLRSADA